MAENQNKPQSTVQAGTDDAATEKQAFDSDGKLKPGYGYRYVPERDRTTGNVVTRKVAFKVGG